MKADEVVFGIIGLLVLLALLLIVVLPEGGTPVLGPRGLEPGQTYECLTEPAQDDGYWYAIVKLDGKKILGWRFKEQPPKKGIAAKLEGKIVLLPYNTGGVTIPNPLFNSETTKQ